MKKMFIVGPQAPDGGSDDWSEPAPRKKSLDRLKALADELGGPFRISVRGKGKDMSHARSMGDTLKRLKDLIDRSEVGDTFRVHTQNGTGPAVLVRVVQIIEEAEVPAAAASWPEPIQKIYEFVFAPGRFPGVQNWGVANCLAAETGVLTRDGVFAIQELAGMTPALLTRGGSNPGGPGRWVEAGVRSFGEQPLMEVRLSRYGQTKAIAGTPDHRWLVRKRYSQWAEKTTSELSPGDVLATAFPQSVASRTEPSAIGVAHGITFGDGSISGPDCRVALFGEKDLNLLRFFPEPRVQPVTSPGGVPGLLVSGLPKFFKRPPALDEGTSYLYGWLAGYFAADGRVTKEGGTQLYSSSRENLEYVRDVCTRLGIGTYGIIGTKRQGYGAAPTMLYSLNLMPATLDSNFFLIPAHRERYRTTHKTPSAWKVESVERTDRIEEVFCAVVPGTETFTLEDNILTGNCRLTRQGGSWSYHAWNQAIDVAPVDKAQGDKIEREVQRNFGADLMTIVWQAPLHFDHLHIQSKPDRSGQTPPCAS